MRRGDLAALGLVVALALGLRLHGLGSPPGRWLDENAHIPAAVHYWEAGQFEPDFWEHPPLRHLMAWAGLELLGDDPVGWRLRNALFGAAAAGLTFLLALRAAGRRDAALLAGLLLATDPLHVVLSRFTFEEIYGGALFLGGVVALQWLGRRSWGVVLSAALVGCALATKWYYVPGWLLLAGLSAWQAGAGRDRGEAAFQAAAWVLVPATVYVASYWPWFGRGYDLGDLAAFTVAAYHSLQSLSGQAFDAIDQRVVFQGHRSAWAWFTGPILLGEGAITAPGRGRFVLYLAGFPAWWATWPAVAAVAVAAARRRSLALAWPALLFAASSALFLGVRRPAFVYSSATLLPFAFTAVAIAAAWVADLAAARLGRWGGRAAWAVPALLLLLNLAVYPVATANELPLWPWGPLLEQVEAVLH